MNHVASFKPYGRGERKHVVLDGIIWFESYSSNSDCGTKLYLINGHELIVGDSPADVQKVMDNR
jgi:hypothetical protein